MLGRFLCNHFSDCQVTTLGLDHSNDISCDLATDRPEICSGYDIVIHAAGSTDAKTAMSVNLDGTKHLCDSLKTKPPQKFIYISSVQVYGRTSGENIDESTTTAPVTQYGKSKLLAEEFLRQWCDKHDVTLSILRPALIIGTGMKGTLRSMVKGIDNGYYFHIKGNKAHRSIVHAISVAQAARLIAPIGGTYNLTDNTHPSVVELAEAIAFRIGNKRIYTLPKWFFNMAARFGQSLGFSHLISTEKLKQLTEALTFDSSLISRTVDWEPLNVTEYLRSHQYSDNDI